MLEDVLTSDLGNAQELMRKPPLPLRRPDSDDDDKAPAEHMHRHPLDGQHGLGFTSRPPAHNAHER